VKDHSPATAATAGPASAAAHDPELAAALREVARELRATRLALAARQGGSGHV
jgi:hypothetical protein